MIYPTFTGGRNVGMDWKTDTKHRATDYGGPIKYPDGFGKQTNPPDDRFIDELVHPAGGRPKWDEELGQPGSSLWPTATELEAKQQKEDSAHEEKSREFRITEANLTGERNKLFDEE